MNERGWNKTLLTQSKLITPPDNIIMKLKSINKKEIIVIFKNESKKTWLYGESYSLNVNLDGKWYDIPAVQPIIFTKIGYLLEVNSSAEKEYSIEAYGDLPSGKYRIVVDGLYAEFDI